MYVPILNTVQAQRLVSFSSMVLKRPSLTWVCYFRFEGINGFLVREKLSAQTNNISGVAIPAAPASPMVFASRVTLSTVLLPQTVITRPSLPQFPPMSTPTQRFLLSRFSQNVEFTRLGQQSQWYSHKRCNTHGWPQSPPKVPTRSFLSYDATAWSGPVPANAGSDATASNGPTPTDCVTIPKGGYEITTSHWPCQTQNWVRGTGERSRCPPHPEHGLSVHSFPIGTPAGSFIPSDV